MMAFRKGNEIIDWQALSKQIHKGIVELRQEDTCTDFTVEVGEKSFRCHKVVLAAMSDYFKAMFTSGMKETEQNKVVLDEVNPDSFQTVMQILYPEGNVNPLEKPSEDEMSDLLKLSGRFQMPFLRDICLKYYGRTMDTGNCILRWKLGRQILCDDLIWLGYRFIKEHFEEIVLDSILVSVEFKDFLAIIKDESIHVKREDIVWSAIKNWIYFDLEKRKEFIVELLRECCLTEIDPDVFMEEIVFDPVVRQSDRASTLLQEAVKYKRHPGIHGDIELKFRECHEKRQVTLLLARENGCSDGVATIERKDMKGFAVCSNKAWCLNIDKRFSFDFDRMEHGVFSCCVHEQSVFVLTEVEKGIRGSKLWQYEGMSHNWEPQRDMDVALKGHTVCATDGCLYVIGGRSSIDLNAQVWLYNIDSNAWNFDGYIMAAVVNASSIYFNNKIYIFGGRLEDNEAAQCIQVYDTQKKEGTIFGNLPKPCIWSRALVRGSTAFVVTSDGDVVSVLLESGETTIISSIPNFKRVNFGISLQQNELYVFGGKEVENDDNVDEEQIVLKRNSPIKGNFMINVETGEVKSSKWLQKVGISEDYEILASASVVIDHKNLKLIGKTMKNKK
ncbi:kelch-like protein 25 [Ruditapes philippinarum]|uniref:kelch-like protein 25 n=1 Tax=Ruditapes philippinarum TaxID=129788 RepID=UPI00295B0174|nr:kelch-like protein 25 [Ruditapes philippinarum]